MKKRHGVLNCGALVLLFVLFAVNLHAETPLESSIESRLYLSFQVQENDLQLLIPDPWRVSAIPAGPAKGANLNVIFIQTLLCETPEGKPLSAGAMSRYMVLAVPVKHTQTGEESSFVTRIYSTDPKSNPGHVKSSLKMDMHREFSEKIENTEPGSASDLWEMKEASGGTIKVRLEYKQSAFNRVKREHKVRYADNPGDTYLYKADQSSELLKSVPSGVDLLQSYEFNSTVPELATLLNDKAKLVSVSEIPCYILQVSQL